MFFSTASLVVAADADNNQQQIDITSAINTRARFECYTVLCVWWESFVDRLQLQCRPTQKL